MNVNEAKAIVDVIVKSAHCHTICLRDFAAEFNRVFSPRFALELRRFFYDNFDEDELEACEDDYDSDSIFTLYYDGVAVYQRRATR